MRVDPPMTPPAPLAPEDYSGDAATELRQVMVAVAWRPEHLDQERGEYTTDGCCCIGARIAGYYGLEQGPVRPVRAGVLGYSDFELGRAALAQRCDMNIEELEDLLQAAGAPCCPFGTEPWPTDPVEVFEKAAQLIEENWLVFHRRKRR